jgi:hypothetical protein
LQQYAAVPDDALPHHESWPVSAVHWLSRRLPLGQSLSSVRLFIALGVAASTGVPLSRKALEAQRVLERGKPGADLIAAFRQAGLLALSTVGPKADQALLVPTPQLLELVAEFDRFHDGRWVSRERYRSRQHCQGLDADMSALVVGCSTVPDCDYLHGYGRCVECRTCWQGSA